MPYSLSKEKNASFAILIDFKGLFSGPISNIKQRAESSTGSRVLQAPEKVYMTRMMRFLSPEELTGRLGVTAQSLWAVETNEVI